MVEQYKKLGIAADRIIVKPKSSASMEGAIIDIDVFGPDMIGFFQVSKNSRSECRGYVGIGFSGSICP